MGSVCGINGMSGDMSLNDALGNLKDILRTYGLKNINVNINSHDHTQEQSAAIAGNIVAGGFGAGVMPAGRPVRHENLTGYFSWNTVEQGSDCIILFYNLADDDQPIDYVLTGQEIWGAAPAGEQSGAGVDWGELSPERSQEQGPRQSPGQIPGRGIEQIPGQGLERGPGHITTPNRPGEPAWLAGSTRTRETVRPEQSATSRSPAAYRNGSGSLSSSGRRRLF